ncbi:hypothetical protein GCM10023322_22040 [Rugosimonospora acidiphila]|uniref:Uncharacterized protein n=1 Tax=Rugosimonospora acidiphila TaxID=556531 RepID=A0ABP9RPA0_9ACTN
MESWRDEKKLPVSELEQAMATYSADGQVDDASGGNVGADETMREADQEIPTDRDPDPNSEAGRRVRPTPDGRAGPV